MPVTIYQKGNGRIINKKIELKIMSEHSAKAQKIGAVEVVIEDLSELPIHASNYPIKKCSDSHAQICLTINAEPSGQQGNQEASKEEERTELRLKQNQLASNICNIKSQAAKLEDQIQTLSSEKEEISRANLELEESVLEARERIEKGRLKLEKMSLKLDYRES